MIAFDKYEMRKVYRAVEKKKKQGPATERNSVGGKAFAWALSWELQGNRGQLCRRGEEKAGTHTDHMPLLPSGRPARCTRCGRRFVVEALGRWKPSSSFHVERSEQLADVRLSVTLPGAGLTPVVKSRNAQLQKRYLL